MGAYPTCIYPTCVYPTCLARRSYGRQPGIPLGTLLARRSYGRIPWRSPELWPTAGMPWTATLLDRLWQRRYPLAGIPRNPFSPGSRRHGTLMTEPLALVPGHQLPPVGSDWASRRDVVMGKSRLWSQTGYGEACTPCVIPCGIPWTRSSRPSRRVAQVQTTLGKRIENRSRGRPSKIPLV